MTKHKEETMKQVTESLKVTLEQVLLELPSFDRVVTTTNLKPGVVKEKGLTAEGVAEKLKGHVVALPVDKKVLAEGRHVALREDGGLTIFSVDMVRAKDALHGCSAADVAKHWYDGFKRSMVNGGNHRAIAVALGLVSGKGAAKREAARLEGVKTMVLGMLKTGLVPRDTIRGIASVDEATWQMWLAEAEEGS